MDSTSGGRNRWIKSSRNFSFCLQTGQVRLTLVFPAWFRSLWLYSLLGLSIEILAILVEGQLLPLSAALAQVVKPMELTIASILSAVGLLSIYADYKMNLGLGV